MDRYLPQSSRIFSAFFMIALLAMTKGFCSAASAASPLPLHRIWFYNEEMEKVVPAIRRDWITAVLSPAVTAGADSDPARKEAVLAAARRMIKQNPLLSDLLYEPGLNPYGCFFRLEPGLFLAGVESLLERLSRDPAICYVRPVLDIAGQPHAFVDTIAIAWKTGVSQEKKTAITGALGVVRDDQNRQWRVEQTQTGYFEAVNLLAEDPRTCWATPQLHRLAPLIQARLGLEMAGALVGDPLDFVLTIQFSPGVKLAPASLAHLQLKPSGLASSLFEADIPPYDPVKQVGESPIRIQGTLRIYAPGPFTLPRLRFDYQCPDCPYPPAGTVSTRPVSVRIASLLPPGRDGLGFMRSRTPLELADRGKFHEKQAHGARWRAMVGFAVGMVAVLSAFLLIRARAKQQQKRPPDPEALSRQALAAFLERPVPTEKQWRYLAEGIQKLRQWLMARYPAADLPVGGTGEQFFQAIQSRLPPDRRTRLEPWFKLTDEAVARQMETHPRTEAFQATLSRILEPASDKRPEP